MLIYLIVLGAHQSLLLQQSRLSGSDSGHGDDGPTTTANISRGACQNGILTYIPSSMRIVTGVTCVLSILGSLSIVLSYFLIPSIRTRVREILVHLSLMDFTYALANLIGISVNFDQYHGKNNTAMDVLCKIQGSFAMYGTESSVYWTVCLAVYIYLALMFEGRRFARSSMYGFYVICYGIPLLETVWFAVTGKLGYSKLGGSGWCSLILYGEDGRRLPFNSIFGNDLSIYVTFILILVMFVSLKFRMKELREGRTILTGTLVLSLQRVEVKLLLVPFIFLLLRFWSLFLAVVEVEAGKPLGCVTVLILLHFAGIGDSAQGIANAILFGIFTPKIFSKLVKRFSCHCLKRARSYLSSVVGNGYASSMSSPGYGSMADASNAVTKPDDYFSDSSHGFSYEADHSVTSSKSILAK